VRKHQPGFFTGTLCTGWDQERGGGLTAPPFFIDCRVLLRSTEVSRHSGLRPRPLWRGRDRVGVVLLNFYT